MTSKCPPTPPPGPECPQQPGPICTQDGSPSHPGLAGRETKEPTKQHSHVRANDAGRRRDLGKLEEALLPPGEGAGRFPGASRLSKQGASRLRDGVSQCVAGREGHLGTPAAQSGVGPGHCAERRL